jgi:integrative and conjugative element protein (TIGR02256 family)
LHRAITQDASIIVPIVADASDPKNATATSALTATTLVIDASAGLDYPRYASTVDSFARHASIFVTPSGNAGVALIEDASRNQRLRTLEAQYYRALIQNDWGREHLAGNLGAFWSGASCRDISMVLPYARVMGHACTFAEQLPTLIASEQARIRVWQQESEQGNVAAYDVAVEAERSLPLDDDLTVFLDAGAERNLREWREQGLPNETGGVLLGYYDYNVKALVVVAALPAPPDSKATSGSFERGIEGLKEAVEEAARRTAGIVGYVGEWHSHPRGHSASPSQNDWIQLIHLALGMGDDGLPGVQLIVGENDLRLLKGAMHP